LKHANTFYRAWMQLVVWLSMPTSKWLVIIFTRLKVII
jgi:hypothetical protein